MVVDCESKDVCSESDACRCCAFQNWPFKVGPAVECCSGIILPEGFRAELILPILIEAFLYRELHALDANCFAEESYQLVPGGSACQWRFA